jgi:RNA polymerase sigma-70 factor (ECF subfamily)
LTSSSRGIAQSSAEDRELLVRLTGDERDARDAFETIFRAWYAPLARATQALVRDAGVAEELAQDVMLELWRRRTDLVAEASAQAYLFRAARNRAYNHLRHLSIVRRRLPFADARASHDPGAPVQLEAAELDTAIQRAMDTLPPRCREVFELSREEGLRYADIADRLGVSVKTVETHMGKALRTLREQLAPWLRGGEPR